MIRLGERRERHRSRRGDAGIGRLGALPPITFATGGCSSLGGQCALNPANGNLQLQLAPPRGDLFTLTPVLSYNSTNAATASEIGNGWSQFFNRHVVVGGTGSPIVITGAGQNFNYLGRSPSGFYPPQTGTINSLQGPLGFSSFTETTPDGTKYFYGAATGQPVAVDPEPGRCDLDTNLRPQFTRQRNRRSQSASDDDVVRLDKWEDLVDSRPVSAAHDDLGRCLRKLGAGHQPRALHLQLGL